MLRGSGKIVTVSSDVDSLELHERQKGFHEVVYDRESRIQVLANLIFQRGPSHEENIETMRKMLDQMEPIDGMYNMSGGLSAAIPGILNGRTSADRPAVYICHEASRELYEKLDGHIHWACINQDPFTQGYFCVRYLFDFLMNGKMPPSERMYTRLEIMMKENILTGPDMINPYQ